MLMASHFMAVSCCSPLSFGPAVGGALTRYMTKHPVRVTKRPEKMRGKIRGIISLSVDHV
jgi:hypothetical protein